MQQNQIIKKIAVLGAGVMGAQIAAHVLNAGFETFLFDLPGQEEDKSGVVKKAIQHLKTLKPNPLAEPQWADVLHACNYDEHLPVLKDCDLIIEAIAENMAWKESLYQRITPFLTSKTILVSNTSGLSINAMASMLTPTQRTRFCGVHFFNPPRYMHLVELIPGETTDLNLLDKLESWLTGFMGKGVVRAKDTPNFIANRVGVFSLLSTIKHAERLGLSIDEVDALTGPLIGRPKSATFRTMDVVGLDTLQHVVKTMHEQLHDDPWHDWFTLPQWLNAMISQGYLGQKTAQGVYRKQGSVIEVFNPKINQYTPVKAKVSDEIKTIMKIASPPKRMQALLASLHPQAQFLSAIFRDVFHYAAYHLEAIANSVADVDKALEWGFGWDKGPFRLWDEAGISLFLDESRPSWVHNIDAFYQGDKAYVVKTADYQSNQLLSIYQRQIKPEGAILFENQGVRSFVLNDDNVVVQFKSKANSIGQEVLDGLSKVIDLAEASFQGLIVYQNNPQTFSSGADLRQVFGLIDAHQFSELEAMVAGFQSIMHRLRYSFIPTVAAVRGQVLGGGCELMMHSDRVVASFEVYPGLVELGVGLIPAGGGCTELARRSAHHAQKTDVFPWLYAYFEKIAWGKVASSAPEARSWGFLRAEDLWVMSSDEVLYAAEANINALNAQHYKPPLDLPLKVAGIEGYARIQMALVNALEGGFISEHDHLVASKLGFVMCGGDVHQGSLVSSAAMMKLEREAFIELASTEKTKARIQDLLETGKPIRN